MNEEVFSILETFTHRPKVGHYAYILAMEEDGKVTFHERVNQPCYGEMRIYNKGGWKPGDLHHPFPSGNPIGVAVNLKGYHQNPLRGPSKDFVFGAESLWAPLLSGRFVPTNDDDGFVMTDCNFDADYWFGFLLSLRMLSSNSQRFKKYSKASVSPLTAWVAAMLTRLHGDTVHFQNNNSYSMQYPSDFKRLLNRDPQGFQGGTFHERKTIRDMPDNMASRIWGGTDKFTDFNGTSTVSLEVFLNEVLPWLEKFR